MALVVPSQYPGVEQVLFKLVGANFNVTTDQQFVPIGGVPINNYFITRIRAALAPASTTTNLTAASKGGSAIVAAAQAYTTLAAVATGVDLTIAAAGAQPLTTTPYLSLTTGQGAAATVNLYIMGFIVTGL